MPKTDTAQTEPMVMVVTTSSFPVFITRSFPKGFQVACACGHIGDKGQTGTDFTAKADGLVAIYRKHEWWHRQNYLAEKAAADELALVANEVEESPDPRPKSRTRAKGAA